MKPAGTRKPSTRTYSKHGLSTLKQTMKALGARAIDMRTSLGKALTQWRAELIADLGGRDAISTQQAAVIDLAVKTKLILDSIDTWLLQQPSLINKRARAVLPVVRERQQLADALARYMTTLGLERRAKPVVDLSTYVQQRYGSAGERVHDESPPQPIARDGQPPTQDQGSGP